MYAGELGSVNSTGYRASTATRSTRANHSNSDMKLSDYNVSEHRSNSTDELDSVPHRNTRGRSLQTPGHQPISVANETIADPHKGFRSTSMYTGLGLQSDESAKSTQFYGTTTGVCIDEKVLTQISQNQAKFMQDRITAVQKHFGNLCDTFGGYARALCKVRDSGDCVSTAVLSLAMDETLNQTAKISLSDFASHFAAVQDYEESEVRRIEERVVKPLMNYGTSCKQAKERLKKACTIRKKELEQKKALDKTKEQKPYDTQHILQAQTDLQKASVNALRADNEVEQEIEAFEKRKLEDLKQILTDFVGIEIFYHIRALEQLSTCSKALTNMNINSDLEQFLTSLRPLSTQTRITAQRSLEERGSERISKQQQPLQKRKQETRQLTYPQQEYGLDDDEEEDQDEDEDETGDENDESEEESSETIPINAAIRPVISA